MYLLRVMRGFQTVLVDCTHLLWMVGSQKNLFPFPYALERTTWQTHAITLVYGKKRSKAAVTKTCFRLNQSVKLLPDPINYASSGDQFLKDKAPVKVCVQQRCTLNFATSRLGSDVKIAAKASHYIKKAPCHRIRSYGASFVFFSEIPKFKVKTKKIQTTSKNAV